MLWSPLVPNGKLTEQLKELEAHDIELVINRNYTKHINELKSKARERQNESGNMAFRLLQILEHMGKIVLVVSLVP